jgi:uncharacterized membrane protein
LNVVGWSKSFMVFEAFRWSTEGGMVGLGDFPGGIEHSYAYGVSGDGRVVVGRGYSELGSEAFRWEGDMVGLNSVRDLAGRRLAGVCGRVVRHVT